MNAFTFNPDEPLTRAPGETQRANDALRDYYLLGPGRSLRLLMESYVQRLVNETTSEKPPSSQVRTLARWSTEYSWQERVAAQTAIDSESLKSEWDERRRSIRESDWTQGIALRDLADRIIATSPDFIKRKEKRIKGSPRVIDTNGKVLDPGEADRVIVTLALDGNLALRAAQVGSQLTRLAAGMETERTAQDVAVSGGLTVKSDIDPTALDDEQLQAYLTRLASFALSLSSGENAPQFEGSPQASPPTGETE